MSEKLKPETLNVIEELLEAWLYEHSFYKNSSQRNRRQYNEVDDAYRDYLSWNTRKETEDERS